MYGQDILCGISKDTYSLAVETQIRRKCVTNFILYFGLYFWTSIVSSPVLLSLFDNKEV